MPALTQHDEVLAELRKLPADSITIQEHQDGIEVTPHVDNGFSVRLAVAETDPRRYSVIVPGRWQLALDTENEALDLFFTCLSEDCRLLIGLRGDQEYSWALELRTNGQWKPVSRIVNPWNPFWRTSSTRILSNPYLLPPTQAEQ